MGKRAGRRTGGQAEAGRQVDLGRQAVGLMGVRACVQAGGRAGKQVSRQAGRQASK